MSWDKFWEKTDKISDAIPQFLLFGIILYLIYMYNVHNTSPDNFQMLVVLLLVVGIKGDQMKTELLKEIRKIKEK